MYMWLLCFLSRNVVPESNGGQSVVHRTPGVSLRPSQGICEVHTVFIMIVRGHLPFLHVDICTVGSGSMVVKLLLC